MCDDCQTEWKRDKLVAILKEINEAPEPKTHARGGYVSTPKGEAFYAKVMAAECVVGRDYRCRRTDEAHRCAEIALSEERIWTCPAHDE